MIIQKSPEQLLQEDAARQSIEAAAQLLESQSGNNVYRAAWRAGAKLIREKLKPR